MKTTLLLTAGCLLSGMNVIAQDPGELKKSGGKISVTIVRESDGKKTVTDTSFDMTDGTAYREFMLNEAISDVKADTSGKDIRMRSIVIGNNHPKTEWEIISNDSLSKEISQDVVLQHLPSASSIMPQRNREVYTYRFSTEDMNADKEHIEKVIKLYLDDKQSSKRVLKKLEGLEEPTRKGKRKRNGKHKIIIIEQA